jgi:hypothetical protein
MKLRSPRSFSFVSCLLASVLFPWADLAAQQAIVPAPHKPIPPRIAKPIKGPTPATRRSMVGGVWMTDANFKSSIYLRNLVETDPVTATPILYLSNGVKYTLSEVTVQPAGIAIININDELEKKGISSWATLSGYVEVDYTWPWDPLCVTVRNLDVVHSLIFAYGLQKSEPGSMAPEPASAPVPMHSLEGMWWKQEPNVTGFVALSNVTEKVIHATVRVAGARNASLGEHKIVVSPHGTKIVNFRELSSVVDVAGGVHITYGGQEGALLASGGLEDQDTGYSATLPVGPLPAKPAKTPRTSFAELGLMIGEADPMMRFPTGTVFTPYSILQNFSPDPAPITATLWWMEGASARSAQLPGFTLLPHETRSLDIKSLLSGAGLKNFNGSLNFILEAPTNAVAMASGSVDQKNTYVFEVIPRGVGESVSRSLSYWSTGDGDDTMVVLWNPADEPQDFVFTLFFSGGQYQFPIHLGPRATNTFNVSEIIQNQVPDHEGNLIPPTVHEGSAKIAGSRSDSEHILLAMDSGVYNVRKATCNPYCTTCNGVVDSWISSSSWDIAGGGQQKLVFIAEDNTGAESNISGTWTSSDTAVATVSSIGLVTGVGPGTATIDASHTDELAYVASLCGTQYHMPSCSNQTTTCSGSASGTVQVPTASRIKSTLSSHSVNSTNFPTCTGTQAGWYRQVQKIVTDQAGADIVRAGQKLSETLTVGAPNNLGITGTQVGTAVTDANGNFNDTFFVCSSSCPASSGQTNASQTISDVLPSGGNPYNLLPNALVYKCANITINGQ